MLDLLSIPPPFLQSALRLNYYKKPRQAEEASFSVLEYSIVEMLNFDSLTV